MSNCPSVNWTHCKYYCYISKSTMFMCILIFQLSFQRIICLFTFWSTISGNIKAFQIVLPNVQTAVSSYWLFWGQHRHYNRKQMKLWMSRSDFFFPGWLCWTVYQCISWANISHKAETKTLSALIENWKNCLAGVHKIEAFQSCIPKAIGSLQHQADDFKTVTRKKNVHTWTLGVLFASVILLVLHWKEPNSSKQLSASLVIRLAQSKCSEIHF